MVNGEKSPVRGFEDLQAWQVAMDIAVFTYETTKSFPSSEIYSLTSQMRRASSSISANIAEGCGRYNLKEKVQFYKIANGSLLELKSFYYLAERIGFIDTTMLSSILPQLVSAQKLISALIRATKERV